MKHICIPLSFILTPLSLLLCPLSLFGAIRTSEQAANIAAQYLNETSVGLHKAPTTVASLQLVHERAKLESAEPAFYIFNKSNEGGFVIVSGDDRTEDVLGYSNHGTIDMEAINPNLRFWLNLLQEAVSATNDTNVHKTPAAEVTPIDPLLVTKDGKEITWYQEAPYNNLCPKDADGYRSLTGCVATAAAMVMYKWCYPEKGTGTHSYQWTNSSGQRKTLTVDYENTTYDWDNMLPAYMYKSTTNAQKTAVATLMYHAGVACDMQYGSEGSGAYTDDMANGLVDYFGYQVDKFITTYSSRYYPSVFQPTEFSVSIAKFTEYFNADLEEGCPIIMGGEDANNGGHEFVCDGRDNKGKFHINWGWEGDGNGFFSLSALNVDGYRFSNNLDAIIGLRPAHVDTIHVTGITITPHEYTLKINEKITLTPTFEPADATDKTILWTTSDSSVALVSREGGIRAMAPGQTIIKATTQDGGFVDSCVISVTDEYVPSESFDLVSHTAELQIGDELIIVATHGENNYALTNTIHTKTNSNYADCEEVVVENNSVTLPKLTNVAILTLGIDNGAWTLTRSDGKQLTALAAKKLSLTTGNRLWTILIDDLGATIASTNQNYGRILYNNNNNDPRFTIYSFGTSTSASMILPQIYVRHKSKPIEVVPVASVAFEYQTLDMDLNDNLYLSYTILPLNATNTVVRWTNGDKKIIAIDQAKDDVQNLSIHITALAEGSTTLSVTSLDGGFSDTCVITVKKKEEPSALNQQFDVNQTQMDTKILMHNTQLLIIKDGHRYNALGIKIE